MSEEATEPIAQISKAIGGNMTKERKGQMYFGKPPKRAYFGFANKDLAHIHDLQFSEEQKARLYGLSAATGEVIDARMMTDSKKGLIDELVSEAHFTRAQAETFVEKYMKANDLTEVDDPVLGKYLAPRGSK